MSVACRTLALACFFSLSATSKVHVDEEHVLATCRATDLGARAEVNGSGQVAKAGLSLAHTRTGGWGDEVCALVKVATCACSLGQYDSNSSGGVSEALEAIQGVTSFMEALCFLRAIRNAKSLSDGFWSFVNAMFSCAILFTDQTIESLISAIKFIGKILNELLNVVFDGLSAIVGALFGGEPEEEEEVIAEEDVPEEDGVVSEDNPAVSQIFGHVFEVSNFFNNIAHPMMTILNGAEAGFFKMFNVATSLMDFVRDGFEQFARALRSLHKLITQLVAAAAKKGLELVQDGAAAVAGLFGAATAADEEEQEEEVGESGEEAAEGDAEEDGDEELEDDGNAHVSEAEDVGAYDEDEEEEEEENEEDGEPRRYESEEEEEVE
eukprot:TRINITY_DN18703_c0_g1_i1.p1 TRINITY_DN18703_c0_g1~~TRINITY_DN18703_c0_g1_i1.p1  ORF type:complete len:380 (+),score=90.59 TRINITY_DN18703_c0_g1_i1:104-1243(+)